MTEMPGDGGEFSQPDEAMAHLEGWDEAARAALLERGIAVESAFSITGEQKDGQPIDADIYWVKLPRPAAVSPEETAFLDSVQPIEGKLYLPKAGSKELAIFDPGFPGGNGGRFEKLYAKDFTDQGVALFTIRHNATSFTQPGESEKIFNCPQRLALAAQQQEHTLGGRRNGGYLMTDLLYEPYVAFRALSTDPQFDRISLVGHSFGAASSLNSIDRLAAFRPDLLEKVGNIVTVAGFVPDEYDEAADRITGTKMTVDELAIRNLASAAESDVNIDLANTERMRNDMLEVARRTRSIQIPDRGPSGNPIGQVMIVSPRDALIGLPEQAATRGSEETEIVRTLVYPGANARTFIFKDETGSNLPDKAQHKSEWIRSENLLRAVTAPIPAKGPRTFTVKNPEYHA